MTPDLPDDAPRALKITLAALVLGLPESAVRGWADRQTVETLSAGDGCVRYIPAYEVARMGARLGLEPDWSVAIRAARAAGSPLV